jgi:hypothetical protein
MKVVGLIVFAAVAVVTNLAASAWEQLAHNIALELAVAGAGLAGLREIWRRVLLPMWWTLRKIDAVYEAVRDLPGWRDEMDQRMADGAAHFDLLDGQMALLQSANKQRVDAALDRACPPRPADAT